MNLFKKRILVLSRKKITNYGDPIIGECCKYIIEKTARENNVRVKVYLGNVYEENPEIMKKDLKRMKAVVFPGGGLNSVVFNKKVLKIFDYIEQRKNISVYFNAIGILRVDPKKKNEALLEQIFNHKQVKQITTRGDYEQLQKYIHEPKAHPSKLVFDPAIWVNEAFGIEKKADSEVIGIGIIRPEIYHSNGNDFSEEDVYNMYIGIIQELEKRGYKWKLFGNGMKEDHQFGIKLLKRLELEPSKYIGARVKSPKALVKKIASFKAVIAARLHANIIATSLQVPSVGLVWNDKMNLFADIIGCQERYIQAEKLLDSKLVVDQVELAIEQGYDLERIEAMKATTVETIKNIVLD